MRFRYSTEPCGKLVKKAAVYIQDEHKINFSDVDSQAVYITQRLQANGYETYIVGGAVRDLILGKKPKDFDIVTAANPALIKRIFRNARIIGRRFRLVHVFFGPKIFEVSTFRSIKDGSTSNTFGTIEEDVLRRDFSLNALFYDPLKQIVVDYVGGMKDIRRRLIRPIISLDTIFTDDPVRMIRAVKYAVIAGFKLPLALKWKIRKQAALLGEVSPSRLTEEILKIIHSPRAAEIADALDALTLYRWLQPGAAECFRNNPAFKPRYLKSLDVLNSGGFKNLPGEALSALVRDYLEDNVDWDVRERREAALSESDGEEPKSPADLYKSAFTLARAFVLPMNPPRMELDSAVRLLFAEHGISVKRPRLYERRPGSGRPAGSAKTREAPEKPETTESESAARDSGKAAVKPHRKRRKAPPRKEGTLQ